MTATDTSSVTQATEMGTGTDPRPIPPFITDPTDEEVSSYLEIFIIALEKLYAKNREAYGMGHVRLVIL